MFKTTSLDMFSNYISAQIIRELNYLVIHLRSKGEVVDKYNPGRKIEINKTCYKYPHINNLSVCM